jgi:sterol desaturase/sphingolipid hydroxylase (fatty acid hydroxylase superfamily)
MTLPSLLVVLATIVFLVLERAFPGRELPKANGWYTRALLVNAAQLGITLATVRVWIHLFGFSVFKLSLWKMTVAEGFVGWFIGTFFFYWWHVLRHKNGFWLVFHQIHHSPSRIEVATSFYK